MIRLVHVFLDIILVVNLQEDNNNNISNPCKEKSNFNGSTEITIDKVKCFYTNADQLRNKMDKLKLQIPLDNPDFIFVTEVLP